MRYILLLFVLIGLYSCSSDSPVTPGGQTGTLIYSSDSIYCNTSSPVSGNYHRATRTLDLSGLPDTNLVFIAEFITNVNGGSGLVAWRSGNSTGGVYSNGVGVNSESINVNFTVPTSGTLEMETSMITGQSSGAYVLMKNVKIYTQN